MEVLIFGPVADVVGADRVEVELGPACTESDVLAALLAQHPLIAGVLRTSDGRMVDGVRLAINHSISQIGTRIGPGDELALIALVGGG